MPSPKPASANADRLGANVSIRIEIERESVLHAPVFHRLDSLRWWWRQLCLADGLRADEGESFIRGVVDHANMLDASILGNEKIHARDADRYEVVVLLHVIMPARSDRLADLLFVNAERRLVCIDRRRRTIRDGDFAFRLFFGRTVS